MSHRRPEAGRRSAVGGEAFPWPTVLFALAAGAFFVIAADPRLAAFYQLPPAAQRPEVRYGVVALLALLAWLDVRRHVRRRARQRTELAQLRAQVDDLWQRNKQLQLKAHTYSEHADKLKLFISDRLLEYIQYDEKFLHFKGIAAEVRHNGVISFDKVRTALQRAMAEVGDGERAPPGAGGLADDCRAALDSLHYLWDLLDLSTAENLTLHIGNLMCECEEQYCQRLLGSEQARALPDEPAYSPRRAVWRALAMVRQEPLPELVDEHAPYLFDDGQLHARLEPVGELLGRQNHLVLLLENLLLNAQFYAARPGYSSPFAPIAVSLTEEHGDVCLRVYNRGPQVRESEQHNLFQLGYSTRRKGEHHGRGLGLYFVNEIVKGYEGRISVRNVHPEPRRFELRLALGNGGEVVETVETTLADGRPQCVGPDGEPARSAEWTLRSPVLRATVKAGPDAPEAVVEGFNGRGRQEFHDPAHPGRPQWRIVYRPKRSGNQVGFEPLDIRGVEFEVRLPTARKRVEGAATELEAESVGAGTDLSAGQ